MSVKVKKITALTGHKGSIYSLLADPRNPGAFYSASGDGLVISWNLEDLSKANVVAKVSTNIFSLELLPEQNLLLVGQMQGSIHVIDLHKKQEIKNLAYHQKGVFDIKQVASKSEFLVAGGDGVLSIWDSNTLEIKKMVRLSRESLRQIAFHPTENIIAIGCSDNQAYIVDQNFEVQQVLEHHENSVFSVCFSHDGQYLLTGSRDAQLCVWETENNFQLSTKVPAHLFTINSIVQSPDGEYFATASRDKTIKLWDAESFEIRKVIDNEKLGAHVNSVNKLLWMEHNNWLISASDDRSIMIWEIEN